MRASRYFGAPQQRTLGTNLDKLQITIELKSTDKGLYLIQIYTLSSGRYNERPTTKAEYFDKKILALPCRVASMVRITGLEPAQPCDHKNLNLTRLPIPPHPHISNIYNIKTFFLRQHFLLVRGTWR